MRTSHYAIAAFLIVLPGLAPAAMAQTCNAYFTQSQELGPLVTEAYATLNPKTPAAWPALLPKLEAALGKLPAGEIKAELCDGNHINAYTTHQYAELSALRGRGIDTGFPANLPLVKQPDLNHTAIAYATGWIKYEQGNFDGALAAYNRGLAMFPHDTSLQQEYLATLIQLKRYGEVVTFADKILNGMYIFDDVTLGKIYAARAVALMGSNDLKGADDNLTVSLRYNNTEETRNMQAQVRAAMPKTQN